MQSKLPCHYHSSSECTKDYVQFYYGNSVNGANLVRYQHLTEGRICDRQDGRYIYSIFSETVTVFFHTDRSGSGRRGLKISFTAQG